MGIRMHEVLVDGDVSDETPQQFIDVVDGHFGNKAELVKAQGVYLGCNRLRPDLTRGICEGRI